MKIEKKTIIIKRGKMHIKDLQSNYQQLIKPLDNFSTYCFETSLHRYRQTYAYLKKV